MKKTSVIEPVSILYVLSYSIYSVILQNLYIDKVCNVNLNHTKSVCDNLKDPSNSQIQNEVQDLVTCYLMYASAIGGVGSVLFCMFLGPWSDRHGRKMPMMLPFCGHIYTALVCLLNTYFMDAPAQFLLFEGTVVSHKSNVKILEVGAEGSL